MVFIVPLRLADHSFAPFYTYAFSALHSYILPISISEPTRGHKSTWTLTTSAGTELKITSDAGTDAITVKIDSEADSEQLATTSTTQEALTEKDRCDLRSAKVVLSKLQEVHNDALDDCLSFSVPPGKTLQMRELDPNGTLIVTGSGAVVTWTYRDGSADSEATPSEDGAHTFAALVLFDEAGNLLHTEAVL